MSARFTLLGAMRARFQAMLMPVGRTLGRCGLNPNLLTTLSLMVAVCAGISYAFQSPIVGGFALLCSGLVDMLDGAVARATKSVSRFGAVYDHVLDRYAEFFAIVGIGLGGFGDWVWIVFSLFGMIMASFTRAKAESVGGLTRCTVGIAERQEKLLILLIGSFLQPFAAGSLMVAVVVVGILSHATVVQRLHYTYTQTRRKDAHV